MSWFSSIKKKILKSKGFKRYITSLLGIVIAAAQFFPELQQYLPELMKWGGILGATSLAHAATGKTLGSYKTGSIAALLVTLLEVANMTTGLGFIVPILQTLVGVFGVGAVGAKTLS